MKILKRIYGAGFVFDTENPDKLEKSDVVPPPGRALYNFHRVTDSAFLRRYFDLEHPIFEGFSQAFYYLLD